MIRSSKKVDTNTSINTSLTIKSQDRFTEYISMNPLRTTFKLNMTTMNPVN